MPTAKERAVVICPGRGTYNATEWGYLGNRHSDKADLFRTFDDYRRNQGQPTLTELDSELPYSLKTHSRGDHASPLIYACAYADFLDIDRERYDIVAVTGNSMGWYIGLAVAGALSSTDGMHLVNTMGSLMHEHRIGGQLLIPWVDDNWQPDWEKRRTYLKLAEDITASRQGLAYLSIDLGGMLVFGADRPGITALEKALPKSDRFPMRLHNHAAFHTPLQQPVRDIARQTLGPEPFQRPVIPLVDGRGHIWTPWSTDTEALWDYTLGHQLTEPYDFTRAVDVTVKEFAPDAVFVLGPGNTLFGAVAQSLILSGWDGVETKGQVKQLANRLIHSLGSTR
ncbi:ACP S-malonyltransferase [Saccharospirillum salsuginis]|uniref:[acyl-carrier-protein] S-malonyltransferase n=1 Tax=Saccharospirillum salsuginis TaxID=418750 RepID=A0A918KFD5_9GAMM|nr:ACP S-malonyltransferase [Saccharospirillum salsuginis]GGX61300.1 acyl carrier protein [Saccharospirillum salsuginis]